MLGTLYAVIVAFMLASVWVHFEDARINAAREANALVDIFRTADGLDPAPRQQLQSLARDYAHTMVTEEWPAMEHEGISRHGQQVMTQLTETVIHLRARTLSGQGLISHLLTEMGSLTEYRRIRQLQSHERLPNILWTVLIVGAVLTVGFSCLFGVENGRYHGLTTMVLTIMVSLLLIAIADVDRPYQGGVHVSPESFQFALRTFAGAPEE